MLWCQGMTDYMILLFRLLFLNEKQELYPELYAFGWHFSIFIEIHQSDSGIQKIEAWFWAKKWSFPFQNRYCFAILIQINFIIPAKRHCLVLTLASKKFLPLFLTRATQECLNTSVSSCNPCPLLSWCSSNHTARPCHSPHAHSGPLGEPGQHLEGRGDRPIPEKAAWFNKYK